VFLLNLPHTIANVFLFARATLGRAPSAHALRETYVEALIDAQDNDLSRAAGPSACFGERRVVKNDAPLLRDYGEISPLSGDERSLARERLAGALALLGRLDRRLLHLVELLVTDVVMRKGEKSGAYTVGWHLGVLQVLPDPAWDVERWAETILHETIHINVFLADLVHGLFRERASFSKPEALVPSAVREGAELRPFDGAFHSACVAVALAYLQFLLGDDRRGAETLGQLEPCVLALRRRSRLLTPYGDAALGQVEAFLEQRSFDALGSSLGDRRLSKFVPPPVQPREDEPLS
jgi:hypothetical protein